MLRIRPFAALRPRPELAARVACVPYDVVDRDQARALSARNPHSFLHVVRPDIDLPDDQDPYGAAVYDGARAAFLRLQTEGTLIREGQPALYLYRQQAELAGQRVEQVGVVGCCHIDDYRDNIIKKHERTRPQKEDDRTRHVLALQANTGPVFLAHRPLGSLAELIAADTGAPPLYDLHADDGVRHTVWKVPDAAPYVAAFARVPTAYVADGHHRSASAARAGAELRERNPGHRGDEPYNWYLCALFASDQLHVLPYHRVVQDLHGLSAEALLARLRDVGHVTTTSVPVPEQPGAFGVYLDGRWYRVTFPKGSIDRGDPVGSLDYELLQRRVLAPLLGIEDPRTDGRIDFVGGIHGPEGLQARADSRQHAVAFALHAVSIEQLMAVADAGQIMPPKSTWFEPKLRSGLLIHTLAD